MGASAQVTADNIALAARAHILPACLVGAIVQVESSGIRGAIRAEPGYRYLWDVRAGKPFRPLTDDELAAAVPPSDFPAREGESAATEWWGQRMSWGPMQIMGAVARELGFARPFGALCDSYTGLQFGCQYLALLVHRFRAQYGWPGVVAAYNAGSPRRDDKGRWVNQGYVDAVAKCGGLDGLAESQA